MKKVILFILLFWSVVFYFSCTKGNAQLKNRNSTDKSTRQSNNVTATKVVVPTDAPSTITTLFADKKINAGSVSVTNDSYFIYVTYRAQKGYVLTQTHLYIGANYLIPVTKAGSVMMEKFPYNKVHKNEISYTYQIPIMAIPEGSCGSIAAQADVVKYNGEGKIIDQQTAWGNGVAINNKNSEEMQFDYCSISQ